MAIPLTKRWIWITGASSGIGRALLERLAGQDNWLIITARNRERLNELQSISPNRIWTLAADISNPECADMMRTKLAEIAPHLDTVILNAGDCEYLDVTSFDINLIERIAQVNYLGFARSVYASLPLLEKSNSSPHIVGISSASVFYGLPRAEAYGASKSAMTYFMQSLRADLYQQEIDVSIVYPGFVDTPLSRKNDFPMPWVISDKEAVEHIVTGIEDRKHDISFPRKLIWSLKALSMLPSGLSVRAAQKMVRTPKAMP